MRSLSDPASAPAGSTVGAGQARDHPKANAFAERWVETVRAECLDWTLVLGRRHLDQVLSTYGDYNAHRPHRGLDLAAPDVPELVDQQPADLEEIDRGDVLGGLIHEYFARAA